MLQCMHQSSIFLLNYILSIFNKQTVDLWGTACISSHILMIPKCAPEVKLTSDSPDLDKWASDEL